MDPCRPFTVNDIAPFLALAEGEGWLCDRSEFEFLLRSFPQGCFTYREGEDTLGYVTSVSYGRSGWIGNLMVCPEVRQHGMICAIEMVRDKAKRTPYAWDERRGLTVYQHGLQRGVLLRPIGNVVYFMPPYVITPNEINLMVNVAREGMGESGPADEATRRVA